MAIGIGFFLALVAASSGMIAQNSDDGHRAWAKPVVDEEISKSQRQALADVRLLEACRRSFQNPESYPQVLLAEVENDPEIGPKTRALEVCQVYLQARVDANQAVIDRYEGR